MATGGSEPQDTNGIETTPPFQGALKALLINVQNFATSEVHRLHEVVIALQEDNDRLHRILSDGDIQTAEGERAPVSCSDMVVPVVPDNEVATWDHMYEATALDEAAALWHLEAAGMWASTGASYLPPVPKPEAETPQRPMSFARNMVNVLAPSNMMSSPQANPPSDDSDIGKQTPFRQGSVASGLDSKAVKEKLRGEKMYMSSSMQYHTSGCFQRIAKSPKFEQLTMFVVVLNAIWMSVDLDFNGQPIHKSPPLFQVAEHTFCSYFVLELFTRFMAFRQKRQSLRDRWFIFDSFLVGLTVTETWIMLIVVSFSSNKNGSSMGNAQVLRLLRLIRLTRIAKMMRAAPELMIMVKGLMKAFRSVMITFVLLFGITYVFAVLFRQLTDGSNVGEESFPNIPSSLMTLLVEGMIPDNGGLMMELFKTQWYLAIIFFLFLFLASLTFMNMLIGLLCEVVSTVTDAEKEDREIEMMTEKLRTTLASIDEDFDGNVSKAEFVAILDNHDAVKVLQNAGVDVVTLVDDADFIFEESQVSAIPFEEFVELVLQFRAGSTTTIRVMSALRKFIAKNFETLTVRVDSAAARTSLSESSTIGMQDFATGNLPPGGARSPSRTTLCPRTSDKSLDRTILSVHPGAAGDQQIVSQRGLVQNKRSM